MCLAEIFLEPDVLTSELKMGTGSMPVSFPSRSRRDEGIGLGKL
ncbi:MAG: hypothetical protein WHX93_15715 [bacterium]